MLEKDSLSTNCEAAKPRFDGNRSRFWEVLAVIFLIAAPSMASWGCNIVWGGEYQAYEKQQRGKEYQSVLASKVTFLEGIFMHVRFLPVILFLIWKSGEGGEHFGLVKPKWHVDILLGMSLAFLIMIIDKIFYSMIGTYSFSSCEWKELFPSPVPGEMLLLLLGRSFAIAIHEELICRCYLIPRLEGMTKSSAKAILISSLVFGALHSYKSAAGIFLTFVSGCIWGATFCKTRRIWPLIVSHALIDYVVFTHANRLIGP